MLKNQGLSYHAPKLSFPLCSIILSLIVSLILSRIVPFCPSSFFMLSSPSSSQLSFLLFRVLMQFITTHLSEKFLNLAFGVHGNFRSPTCTLLSPSLNPSRLGTFVICSYVIGAHLVLVILLNSMIKEYS